MAEQEKPFICYRKGWSMQIVPRGRAGWTYFVLWMLSIAPLIGCFALLVSTEPTGAKEIAYTTGFVLIMFLWAIAMIVWMKNRSEVVDMDEMLKLKREADARKGRGRR
jgi:hypothetical protein